MIIIYLVSILSTGNMITFYFTGFFKSDEPDLPKFYQLGKIYLHVLTRL